MFTVARCDIPSSVANHIEQLQKISSLLHYQGFEGSEILGMIYAVGTREQKHYMMDAILRACNKPCTLDPMLRYNFVLQKKFTGVRSEHLIPNGKLDRELTKKILMCCITCTEQGIVHGQLFWDRFGKDVDGNILIWNWDCHPDIESSPHGHDLQTLLCSLYTTSQSDWVLNLIFDTVDKSVIEKAQKGGLHEIFPTDSVSIMNRIKIVQIP